MTPGKNVVAGVVDTCIDDRGLLLLQNYLRPPKSATAADIVIGRPRRPPKLLQTKTALFSFGGLRGLWSRCVFGCNFSWRFQFQWHRRRLRPTSEAGDIADLYPSTFSFPWQLPTSLGVFVLVTGNKFIAGVVVTGDKVIAGVVTGHKVIAGVVVTSAKFFTGINDTGDHWKSVTKINRRCQRHRQ